MWLVIFTYTWNSVIPLLNLTAREGDYTVCERRAYLSEQEQPQPNWARTLSLKALNWGANSAKSSRSGFFFKHVVEKSHRYDEFLGVFVFFEYAGSAHALCHGGEVVMSAEVEIHHFGHFTVLSFNHVEEVGLFFFVHNLWLYWVVL